MTSFGNSRHAVVQDGSIWVPTMAFFRAGAAETRNFGRVSWKFESIKSRLPFNFILCELTAFGETVRGQGCAVSLREGMCRALGEAWERAWMHRLTSTRPAGLPHFSSSNGFAAGQTNEAAIRASRSELIERAALLSAWSSMRGWKPHRSTSLVARLGVAALAVNGWRLQIFRLGAHDVHIVLAGLARHPQFGAIFDTIYAGDQSAFKVSESRLVKSLARSAEFSAGRRDQPLDELPEEGHPHDHARYYRDPSRDRAFDFLNQRRNVTDINLLNDAGSIESHLLVPAGELPAVAVSFHPSWPELTWGKSSIRGANPWPHPLA